MISSILYLPLKVFHSCYYLTTGFKIRKTASRDNIDLIGVVMGSPSNKTRFQDAMALLDYGYSVSALVTAPLSGLMGDILHPDLRVIQHLGIFRDQLP